MKSDLVKKIELLKKEKNAVILAHYYCTDEKYIRYAEKRLKTYKTRRFFVLLKAKFVGGIKKIIRIFKRK